MIMAMEWSNVCVLKNDEMTATSSKHDALQENVAAPLWQSKLQKGSV